MLGSAVAGFLLHCLLNFPCHTSINLIVQNKWANFWSHRLCLQDRSGGLLTSRSSVEASPSFGWNISTQHQWPFLLFLRPPFTALAEFCHRLLSAFWSSSLKSQTAHPNKPGPLLPVGSTKTSLIFLWFFRGRLLLHFGICLNSSLRSEAPGCKLAPCYEVTPSSSVGVTGIMETIAPFLGLKIDFYNRYTDVILDQNSWWNIIFKSKAISWMLAEIWQLKI